MNSAVLAPLPSAQRIRRSTRPGRVLRRIGLAIARVGSHATEGVEPHELHRLQQEAESLRTENFRAVAMGRLL